MGVLDLTNTKQLILDGPDGRHVLGARTLIFAIDDTGHEDFADPNYRVFGLGGCGCVVEDYERLIALPWNYMCATYFKGVPRPMHAAGLRVPTAEQLDAFRHFFEKFQFSRIACTVSHGAKVATDQALIQVMGGCLLNRMVDVAKWYAFDRVFVLIEASERLHVRIAQSLAERGMMLDGKHIPIELAVLPKALSFPALEVADFIVHTAGAQTRARGSKPVRKDFEIIFRNVDKRLVSFIEITQIEDAQQGVAGATPPLRGGAA